MTKTEELANAQAHLEALCHAYETAPVTNANMLTFIGQAALRVHSLQHVIAAEAPAPAPASAPEPPPPQAPVVAPPPAPSEPAHEHVEEPEHAPDDAVTA